MPAAAEGHKTYIPKEEGKARREVPVDKRGVDAKVRGIREGCPQQRELARKQPKPRNKEKLRSQTPIPRQGQRPQEKVPKVNKSVLEA